jgi:hypothetical protein
MAMGNKNWKLVRLCNRQSGQVLILVLIFMILGAILIPPLLALAASVNKSANAHQIRTSGVYAADSGAQEGFWQLLQPFPDTDKIPLASPVPPYSIADVNNKQVQIQISVFQNYAPDYMVYKIESTATGDGSTSRIEAYVKNTLGEIGLGDNAIFADDAITFTKNNSSVASIVDPEGNSAAIWSNGDITAEDGADIRGNVWAAGDISGGTIHGESWSGVPQHAAVVIDSAPFIDEADAARNNAAPDTPPGFFAGGGTFNGSYYVTGSLDISGDTIINGDIFVDGDLTVSKNLTINGALYVQNDVGISGNGSDLHTTGTILIGGNLDIDQSQPLNQGGTIVIMGNITLKHKGIGPPDSGAAELPSIMMYGETFTVAENDEVRAFIYAPNAYLNFDNAASSGLEGAVIAKSISLGNQDFVYRNDILGNAYGGFGQQSHGTPDEITMEKWHLD